MAGIFDFLSNSPEAIDENVKNRRLQDWQKSMTKAGDDAMKARAAGVDLAESRAGGAGKEYAKKLAAKSANVLSEEAWRRSAGAASAAEAGGLLRAGAMGAAKTALGVPMQAALYSGDVEAAELTPEQREAKNPGETADAQAYAQRVQDNARKAFEFYKPQEQQAQPQQGPQGPLNPNADMDSPQDVQAAQAALQAGPQQDPEAVAQQVEQEKQATEAKRQVVERGAVEALRTNQVSRPQLAEEVVKADLARKGETATPDQLKTLVQQEATEMRTMDNKDLSKYVSYALIAGGIAAAFMDKSGRAGDAFSAGFNKQLDRNLVQQKMKAAQQQQEVENKQNAYKIGQTDRKIKIEDRNADTAERKAEGVLGNYATQEEIARENLLIRREGNSLQAANNAATNDIRRAQLDQNAQLAAVRQSNEDRNFGLNERRTGAAELRASGVGGMKAPDLATKDSDAIVKQFTAETGQNLSKASLSIVSQQFRTLAKNYPEVLASNPQALVQQAIAKAGLKVEAGSMPWSDDTLVIPKPTAVKNKK